MTLLRRVMRERREWATGTRLRNTRQPVSDIKVFLENTGWVQLRGVQDAWIEQNIQNIQAVNRQGNPFKRGRGY